MGKILVTVPDLSLPGGVANIFRSIKWDTTDNVTYFFNTARKSIIKPWFIPLMYFRFLAKIRKTQLLHLNPSLDFKGVIRDGTLLLIASLLNKRVIIFFHGWDENFEKAIVENRIYRKIFVLVFSKADAFLLLGSVFQQKLCEIGIEKKNYYLLPAVANKIEFKNSRVGVSNNITILFLSRFVPLKGMDIVLKTFEYLQNNAPSVRFNLIMAGDGPELEDCKKYVTKHSLPRVTFTGYVDGLAKHNCYSCSDILFFPSHTEGLPCVIMEAMSYGLAIVTRPVGGIPDWVRHYENGWVSDSTEPSKFAEGILSLVENSLCLKEIKERNQNLAREMFTPEKFKCQLERIYKIVLDAQYDS